MTTTTFNDILIHSSKDLKHLSDRFDEDLLIATMKLIKQNNSHLFDSIFSEKSAVINAMKEILVDEKRFVGIFDDAVCFCKTMLNMTPANRHIPNHLLAMSDDELWPRIFQTSIHV